MSRGKARSVWRGNFFLQKAFFWLWNLRISARRFADKPSCNSSGFEFIQIESLGKVPWGHPHIHLQQKGWCKLGSYSEFREFVLSFWKRERERKPEGTKNQTVPIADTFQSRFNISGQVTWCGNAPFAALPSDSFLHQGGVNCHSFCCGLFGVWNVWQLWNKYYKCNLSRSQGQCGDVEALGLLSQIQESQIPESVQLVLKVFSTKKHGVIQPK